MAGLHIVQQGDHRSASAGQPACCALDSCRNDGHLVANNAIVRLRPIWASPAWSSADVFPQPVACAPFFCRTTPPIATNYSPHWYDALAENFTENNYFAPLFCFGDYSLRDSADCRSWCNQAVHR